jgi:hypothetical protein
MPVGGDGPASSQQPAVTAAHDPAQTGNQFQFQFQRRHLPAAGAAAGSGPSVIGLRDLKSMEEFQRNNAQYQQYQHQHQLERARPATGSAPLVPPRLGQTGAAPNNPFAFQFSSRGSQAMAELQSQSQPQSQPQSQSQQFDDSDAYSITSDMLPREAPGSRGAPSQLPVEFVSQMEIKGNLSPMALATKPAALQPVPLPVPPRRRPAPRPPSTPLPSTPPPPLACEETPPPPASHIAYPTPQPPPYPPSPGTPLLPPPLPTLQSPYTPGAAAGGERARSYHEIQALQVGDGEDTCQSYELQDANHTALYAHGSGDSAAVRRPAPVPGPRIQVRSNVDLL